MYSKELADAMKSYLDSKNCNYDFDEEDGGFIFRTCDDGKIQKLLFVIQVNQHSYNICVILEDFEVTEANIDVISEYTHRCNDVCCQCRLEVGYDYNIVVCTQMLNCNGIIPDNKFIGTTIIDIIYCIDKYCDGLVDVIEGKSTPKEIFDKYKKDALSEETLSLKYSKEIAEAIKEYMKSIDMKYEFDEENGILMYNLKSSSNLGRINGYICVYESAYDVVSNIDFFVEDNAIADIYECLSKINCYSSFTNLIFSQDKKIVYGQCHTNCEGIIPTKEIIEESIFGADMLVNTYGDILCDVAEGKEIDQEAFQRLLMEDKERKC